jgi:hypothetical protein
MMRHSFKHLVFLTLHLTFMSDLFHVTAVNLMNACGQLILIQPYTDFPNAQSNEA